jgi:hypothetical protein
MEVLGLPSLDRFKAELLQHLSAFSPELHALRGDGVFRQVIDDGVAKAASYGFTNRGPVRFFLECMLTYGVAFDTDFQIRDLRERLVHQHGNGQAWHADRAFTAIERYQLQTRGRDNDYAIAALERLGPFLERLDALTENNFDADLLETMARIYPEKFRFVGEERLRRLVAVARDEATHFAIPTPGGIGLLAGLMFALGLGICRDPLYPWIHDTLVRPGMQDPIRRIERLRRKTRLYLRATLKNLHTPA